MPIWPLSVISPTPPSSESVSTRLAFTSGTYGLPGATLSGGLQYDPAALHTVTLDPGVRPDAGQVDSPNYYIDPMLTAPAESTPSA